MKRSESHMLVIQSNKYTQKFQKLAHGAREQDSLLLRQIANDFSPKV